jgi:hypothetical protein
MSKKIINSETLTREEKLALLGQTSKPDVRDHKFGIRRPAKIPGVTTRMHFARGVWDQGFSSRCVEYSSLKYLEAGPVRNIKNVPFKPGGGGEFDFYHQCQLVDEWPGTNYDGTSVRAAMKVLQEHGFIGEYRWAWDVGTIVNFLLSTGPMVFGTLWTDSMFDVTTKGFIDVQAKPEGIGGHAYLGVGANTTLKCPDGTKGAIRILNSWGAGWGQDGRAWLPLSQLDILMKEDGEAACAMEILK